MTHILVERNDPPAIIVPVTAWVVEGDDHEVRVYLADSSAEANELAVSDFRSQYDVPPDSDDPQVSIMAAFRLNPDDEHEPALWDFLPCLGKLSDESRARRMLATAV